MQAVLFLHLYWDVRWWSFGLSHSLGFYCGTFSISTGSCSGFRSIPFSTLTALSASTQNVARTRLFTRMTLVTHGSGEGSWTMTTTSSPIHVGRRSTQNRHTSFFDKRNARGHPNPQDRSETSVSESSLQNSAVKAWDVAGAQQTLSVA